MYLSPEFLLLHSIMADLKYDVRVIIDVVELKIIQRVLMSGVKVLTKGSKYGVPVRYLKQKQKFEGLFSTTSLKFKRKSPYCLLRYTYTNLQKAESNNFVQYQFPCTCAYLECL